MSPRPLFLIGNKRSGTSLLVKLLNHHPSVVVTYESDVIWLLYQMRHGWPRAFERYRWDGPLGLKKTLDTCDSLLRESREAAELPGVPTLFRRIQAAVLTREAVDAGQMPKASVVWLGDKKPVQQCDPEIRPFLTTHFGDARYLHIVRHPVAVVRSMQAAAASWSGGVPPYWHLDAREILERWSIHEEWVLDAKDVDRVPVHSFRLEDLAAEPTAALTTLFAFLDLEVPAALEARMITDIDRAPNRKYAGATMDIPARARRIMEHYGYEDLPQD